MSDLSGGGGWYPERPTPLFRDCDFQLLRTLSLLAILIVLLVLGAWKFIELCFMAYNFLTGG